VILLRKVAVQNDNGHYSLLATEKESLSHLSSGAAYFLCLAQNIQEYVL
jgi:hypothetical protein